MLKIAIMASGNGSNANVLFEHALSLSNIKIVLLITDNRNANVLNHCQNYDIPFHVIEKNQSSQKEHESKIIDALKSYEIDFILLAGYMKLVSKNFISVFTHQEEKNSRIINIHPSLLPNLPGLDAYERAYNHGYLYSGITIHYVDSGIDTGDIILQSKFDKNEEDTLEDFKKKGLKVEHELYPYFLTNLNQNFKSYEKLELS